MNAPEIIPGELVIEWLRGHRTFHQDNFGKGKAA